MKHIKKHSTLIVSIILGAFFLLSLSLAWQEATTFDERAHVPAAYSSVRYGDMNLNPEHPPLLKDLAGIPLQFMDLSFPTDAPEWRDGANEQWTLGTKFLFGSGNDADMIMFWARVPIILVALLLGLLVYRWTKELAGTAAGLFALLLYAADPNIIAHGHYVTTDLGIAAGVLGALYLFVRFLKRPTAGNTILLGIGLGTAQLIKFSAVLLYPYFGLVILLYALSRSKPDAEKDPKALFLLKDVLRLTLRYGGAILLSLSLIWLVYLPNTLNEPASKVVETAHAFFPLQNDASRLAIGVVETLSGSAIGKPAAQYLLGLFKVFSRVAGGNTYFFIDTISADASPWYFPTVFLLKETLPVLFLLAFGAIYTLFRMVRAFADKTVRSPWNVVAHSVRSHIAQYAMFGFVALYVFVSVTGNLNIGFRHLFPILPILYVLVAKTLFDFARRGGFQNEHATRAAIAGIAFWVFSVPVLSYPSYLSYFNEAAGGPGEGYRYVTDSNYDWGQDLKRLSAFVDGFNACKAGTAAPESCERYADILRYPAIDEIRTAYFGGADPKYYLGDRYVEWYADWGKRPGWHAISATYWQEKFYRDNPEGKETYQWIIDGHYPLAWRAGDSIFVYYVPPFGR